jgi:hypothetical protein
MARNVAFLALAVVIGVVVYVALNGAINRVVEIGPRTLPLTTGATLAVAALVAGLQFGGRLAARSFKPWAICLGAALSVILIVPSLIVHRSVAVTDLAPSAPGLILLLLVFLSAFLGVRATATGRNDTSGTDA